MKSRLKSSMVGMVLAIFCGPAWSIPSLQLGIEGGIYDPITQTVIAQSKTFTLYAYLIEDSSNLLADDYFLSAAVVPRPSGDAPSLGSFSLDAAPIAVTSAMTYGVPPIDAIAGQLFDAGDLSKHGIFPTWFVENKFSFSSSNYSATFNVQDNPGKVPSQFPYVPGNNPNKPNDKMYYMAFAVNVTSLASNYAIHFDLYNTQLTAACNNTNGNCVVGDIDVNQFAPFSHDAQSGPGGNPPGPDPNPVPEPGVLSLLGIALLSITALRRRRV